MNLKKLNLPSQKKKSVKLSTPAGFPPYVRGNNASGYLLSLPQITKTISSELETYSFLYKEGDKDWENIIYTIKHIQKDLQQKKINEPILVCKITDNISLEWIALIRAIRLSWSILNVKNGKSFIPLQIKIQTPFGYHPSLLKILSAEIDGIISEVLTENIMKDFINDFKLLKTIDPFGGSNLIENKTKSFSEIIIQKITS